MDGKINYQVNSLGLEYAEVEFSMETKFLTPA